jgi:hypothetical protein
MPYNPGVVDNSGQIRANYHVAGINSLVQGATAGLAKWDANREKEKSMQGIIKAAETMAKGFEVVGESIDPKLKAVFEGAREAVSNPSFSTTQRAAAAQSFLDRIPDLLKSGTDGMQLKAQQQQAQQIAMAKAAEFKLQQDKVIREQRIGELEPIISAGVRQLPEWATPDLVHQATFNLWKKESEMNKELLGNRRTAAETEKLHQEIKDKATNTGKLGTSEIVKHGDKEFAVFHTSAGQVQIEELNKGTEFASAATARLRQDTVKQIRQAISEGREDEGFDLYLSMWPSNAMTGMPSTRPEYDEWVKGLSKSKDGATPAGAPTTSSKGLKLPPGASLIP